MALLCYVTLIKFVYLKLGFEAQEKYVYLKIGFEERKKFVYLKMGLEKTGPRNLLIII